MNDKANPNQDAIPRTEIEEIRRDMRAAEMLAWAQRHQQQLIAAGVALALGLAGLGLWLEHRKTQRESAAMLYQQALAEKDEAKKRTLLERLSQEFGDAAYGAMAEMQLAAVDREHAAEHLKRVVEHPEAMQEWVWQARLDLARIALARSDRAAAARWLQEPVGPAFRQLRHYLLAQASESRDERLEHLNKALAADSHDEELKARIERELAALQHRGDKSS